MKAIKKYLFLFFCIILGATLIGCCKNSGQKEILEGVPQPTKYFEGNSPWSANTDDGLNLSMQTFYETTGIAPFLYDLTGDELHSEYQLQQIADNYYKENFSDESHFLIVFQSESDTDALIVYHIGRDAETILDTQAIKSFTDIVKSAYANDDIKASDVFPYAFITGSTIVMASTDSNEALSYVFWTVFISCISFIFVLISIPFFIIGLVNANAKIKQATANNMNPEPIKAPKSLLIMSFVIVLIAPIVFWVIGFNNHSLAYNVIGLVVSIICFILVIVSKAKIAHAEAPAVQVMQGEIEESFTSNTFHEETAQPVFSKADEISKMKQLLDNGTLTPEEFEQAKKDILNK